jgi:hypothetical protein
MPSDTQIEKTYSLTVRHNTDGEFGAATGWLYRTEGEPCAVTGEPVYVWRPLKDLLDKSPDEAGLTHDDLCPRCKGTGAIDAPTSGDDPSCPDCDGEGRITP